MNIGSEPMVVHVDGDFGNGNPYDDDNNDLVDKTHKTTIQNGVEVVASGGRVLVHDMMSQPGLYNENVVISRSLTLSAVEPGITIDGQGASYAIRVYADMVEIQGFTIAKGTDGIFSHGATNLRILNNEIIENEENGIELNNCGTGDSTVTISGNKIDNNGENGIYVENCNDVVIDGNPSISGNGKNGIHLFRSDDNIIRDNPSIDYNGYGPSIALDERSGIILRWSNDNRIMNNFCEHNDGFGIGLRRDSDINLVEENELSHNGDDGINLRYGSDYNVVNRNKVHHNEHEGIHIRDEPGDGASSNNIIENNDVHHNGLGGIYISAGGGPHNVIRNNHIHKNIGSSSFEVSNNGILIRTSNSVMVDNNKVHHNSRHGLFINRDTSTDTFHVVERNDIYENGIDGIKIENANKNEIKNSNKIHGNQGNDINLKNSKDNRIFGDEGNED